MKLENWLFLGVFLGLLMVAPMLVILVIAIFGASPTFNQVAASFFLAFIGVIVGGVAIALWTDTK